MRYIKEDKIRSDKKEKLGEKYLKINIESDERGGSNTEKENSQ